MFSRDIGKWHINAGEGEGYRQALGEDGYYTERVPFFFCDASSSYGEVFTCTHVFHNAEEAEFYAKALPQDFDPDSHPDFTFSRNIYGSEAYADNWHDEELSRMDYEERRAHGW